MRKSRFKTDRTKLALTFLLIIPVFIVNIPPAHASLRPFMFNDDVNLAEFTFRLISNSLYAQRESLLNENTDSKKDNKKIRIRIHTAAHHFDRTY